MMALFDGGGGVFNVYHICMDHMSLSETISVIGCYDGIGC